MPKAVREMQVALSKKWNDKFVKKLPVSYKKEGIAYVEHTQVTQRLIAIIPDINMEIKEMIYDNFTNPQTGEEKNILTGIVYKITGTIDNEFRIVEEIGMCDKPFYNPNPEKNIKILTNGERGKECLSDAIKRCGMRLGIGIELYESDVWLVDYLAPQPKLEKKPSYPMTPDMDKGVKKIEEDAKAIKEKGAVDPKSNVDPKPKQVDLNNIDDVVKEIADKKSVSS